MARRLRVSGETSGANRVRVRRSARFWLFLGLTGGATVGLLIVVLVLVLGRSAGPLSQESRKPQRQLLSRAEEGQRRVQLRAVPVRTGAAQPQPTVAPSHPAEDQQPPTPEPKATREPGWENGSQSSDSDGGQELGPPPPPSDYGWKGPTGIALFPPPGTNPPKPGIVVPDGYNLPPGYVRHYQTTDDGRSLEPILMFHPDYEFVDEDGNRIEIPPDRIVPPELAPPDLPIRVLEIPEPDYQQPPEAEVEKLFDQFPELLDPETPPEEVERILEQHRSTQD